MSPGLRSSGREPWTFRATDPAQLPGEHADLMGRALEGERPEYLLYAPAFDAHETPFGHTGAVGSHAVALIRTGILVSENPHLEGVPSTVGVIPLDRVLTVEIGQALVLGWLAIRAAATRQPASPPGVVSTVVLFGSSGLHHFQALVRAYRALPARTPAEGSGPAWDDAWGGTPPYLRSAAQPLVAEGERLRAVMRCEERWSTARRGRRSVPVCAASAGLLLSTDLGLLWCLDQPRAAPGSLAFGVNTTCVRPEVITRTALHPGRGGISILLLDLAAADEALRLSVPLTELGGGCRRC